MRFHRLPVKDPRTVARDIPGICDLLFPQLLPAIITHLNRQAKGIPSCAAVPEVLLSSMSTNAAMLFEVAYARSEEILKGHSDNDWIKFLQVALNRQSKYFDADLPEKLSENDIEIATRTSNNLIKSLEELKKKKNGGVEISPKILGYHWISKGNGDFAIDDVLIEVKCSSKNFGSSDYRQLLMYWLLSFAGSVENKAMEWKTGILLNPRLNKYIEINFNDLVSFTAAGRSKIEVLELFHSIVSDYSGKLTG